MKNYKRENPNERKKNKQTNKQKQTSIIENIDLSNYMKNFFTDPNFHRQIRLTNVKTRFTFDFTRVLLHDFIRKWGFLIKVAFSASTKRICFVFTQCLCKIFLLYHW